jgi:hypothetical protein
VSHPLPRAARRLRRVPIVLTTLGKLAVALASLWCKNILTELPRSGFACAGEVCRQASPRAVARSPPLALSYYSSLDLDRTTQIDPDARSTRCVPVNTELRRWFCTKAHMFPRFTFTPSCILKILTNRSFLLRF